MSPVDEKCKRCFGRGFIGWIGKANTAGSKPIACPKCYPKGEKKLNETHPDWWKKEHEEKPKEQPNTYLARELAGTDVTEITYDELEG